MLSPAGTVWLASYLFSFVSGLMGNMFILIANVIHCLKGNTDLTSCDLIISSLAICNLGDLCLFFILYINHILSHALIPFGKALKVMAAIRTFAQCCSFWFCTLFCIYCCVKIVRFTHPVLVQLAMRFLANVPWVLLASVFLALATSLPITIITEIQTSTRRPFNISTFQDNSGSRNGSVLALQFFEYYVKLTQVHFPSISLVYMIFLLSAVMILITLCRHMNRMGQNADGFTNPRRDAPLSAVRTVALLLILYSLYYWIQCVGIIHGYSADSPTGSISRAMHGYFPAVNSIILIFGISRLKKTLCIIISHILCSEGGGP